MHEAPSEPEGVLPGNCVGGARPAKTDYSSRGIVIVIVAESGKMDVERGTACGTQADPALRQREHSGGIGLDKNGGSWIVCADDGGCAVGNIDNRRSGRNSAGARSKHKARHPARRGIDLVEIPVGAP